MGDHRRIIGATDISDLLSPVGVTLLHQIYDITLLGSACAPDLCFLR